jgi:hypothetical protein
MPDEGFKRKPAPTHNNVEITQDRLTAETVHSETLFAAAKYACHSNRLLRTPPPSLRVVDDSTASSLDRARG